jgi:hypothetical protein
VNRGRIARGDPQMRSPWKGAVSYFEMFRVGDLVGALSLEALDEFQVL